jgi:hypothetical protein
MSREADTNPVASSWLGRLWQNFLLFGEAMETSEAELLERRVAALKAAVAKANRPANQA